MVKQFNRRDIFAWTNQIRFRIHHYAHGTYFQKAPTRSISPVNRIFCPLVNPNGGKYNYIESDHSHYDFQVGKLYFIPAHLPSLWALDTDLEFLSIHTTFEIIPGVELFSSCHDILEMDFPEEIGSLLHLHDTEENDDHLKSMHLGALVYSLQTKIAKMYPEENFKRFSLLKKYAKITDFLFQYGNARTSVADLAELNGETRESFSRNFSASTGISPKKLIDSYVLSRSLEWMATGIRTKEIAEKMCFNNEFTFSRYFKRMTGISPRDWKKKSSIF